MLGYRVESRGGVGDGRSEGKLGEGRHHESEFNFYWVLHDIIIIMKY